MKRPNNGPSFSKTTYSASRPSNGTSPKTARGLHWKYGGRRATQRTNGFKRWSRN